MVTNSVRLRFVRVTPCPVHTPGPDPAHTHRSAPVHIAQQRQACSTAAATHASHVGSQAHALPAVVYTQPDAPLVLKISLLWNSF